MNLNPADSHAKYSKCVEKSLSRLLQPLFLWLNVLHCKSIFTVFVQCSFISVKFTFQLFRSLKKFSCGKVPQHWTLLTPSDKWSLFLVCWLFLFVTDVHASTYFSNLAEHNGLSLHTYILLQGFHFFFCSPWSCVVSSIDFFGLQLYRSIACSIVIARNLLAPFSSATRLATQYL